LILAADGVARTWEAATGTLLARLEEPDGGIPFRHLQSGRGARPHLG
jgi:hypothetical protein